MNFNYIETLVTKCKNNDEAAKEKLSVEFRPLIYNISKRTFIDGYNVHDNFEEDIPAQEIPLKFHYVKCVTMKI